MLNDKVLNCKECDQDFEFTVTEQEFFAKKGSRTNLDVVLSAVQPEKQKMEVKVAAASAVVDFPVDHAKCSQLFALLAGKIRWFLFNLLVKTCISRVLSTPRT